MTNFVYKMIVLQTTQMSEYVVGLALKIKSYPFNLIINYSM